MSTGKFYLISLVLLLSELVFILQVMIVGNGDIWGSLSKGIISVAFIFLVYKGMRWAKWVLVAYFVFMALACAFAGAENNNLVFYVLIISYAFLTYQIFSIEFSDDNQAIAKSNVVPDIDVPESTPKEFAYPSLVRRYQALFIDGILLFAVMIIVMILVDENENRQAIMIGLFLVLVLFYEPLLTVYAATAGQRLLGIRVRYAEDPTKRINLFQAYARILVKGSLGWLSFLTIHGNQERRAIHDFAGSSVVIEV